MLSEPRTKEAALCPWLVRCIKTERVIFIHHTPGTNLESSNLCVLSTLPPMPYLSTIPDHKVGVLNRPSRQACHAYAQGRGRGTSPSRMERDYNIICGECREAAIISARESSARSSLKSGDARTPTAPTVPTPMPGLLTTSRKFVALARCARTAP